jgi:hypothetical protein
MAKQGRPSRFNDAIKEKIIDLAEKGKTNEQIADIIGVHVRTIENWQGKHPDLLWAIKEAKQIADDLVEASLFSRAVGYSHPEQKVFQNMGEIITHETIKQYPPDPTAMIFWLKNRQPKRWREKQPGEDDKTITLKSNEDLDARIKELEEEIKGK